MKMVCHQITVGELFPITFYKQAIFLFGNYRIRLYLQEILQLLEIHIGLKDFNQLLLVEVKIR